MTAALDTNIIAALWDANEVLHTAARQALERAWKQDSLVICGAVYAELIAAPQRTEEFIDRFCEETGISVEWELKEKVWREAGLAFQKYSDRRRKQSGGQPRRILTDFLIGAHAVVNGYNLLTLDEGIYRAAFPKLALQRL